MLIDEITYLDEIFKLERKKEISGHINITNISHWNPSQIYKGYIEKCIQLNKQKDIFDYTYTYDLTKNKRLQIMERLGVQNPMDAMCLLNPSGTNTIINVINFLKMHNYHKIGILTPSYFSVEQSCRLCNLLYEKIDLQYIGGKFVIPIEYILEKNFDAIWLTSPAYSTGISYDDTQINNIKKIISKNILVIADESLAMPNQMLLSKIPINDYFFCICTPHKTLFINKIKFSALICPQKNDDFLEQWIDILSGSLLSSNLIAIQHFLSNNFIECLAAAQHWFKKSANMISDVLQQFPDAQCNLSEVSPYKTIYLKSTKRDLRSLESINMLISNEYTSFIPISFNEYTGFRINLSLAPQDIYDAVYRILKYYT